MSAAAIPSAFDERVAGLDHPSAPAELIVERRAKLRTYTHLDGALEQLWQRRGTDLLITAGRPPLARIDGDLCPVPGYEPLTPLDTAGAAESLLSEEQLELFNTGAEIDFAFSWREKSRIRGNAFHQRDAAAIALRMIPADIPSFDDLRLPPAVRDLGTRRQGLVFVTGPTGSGKSTTLASIIGWINKNRPCHILTIEDPIEYMHHPSLAAVSQREVGRDTATFGTALRSALRETPDVILVGEMRDLESIQFALTLAETGHLVFATLHTNDAAQAVDRLIDVFPSDQQPQVRVQLSSCLTAIVYQRLLPKTAGGVVAAYEVLMATGPVKNLIKEGKTIQLRNQLVTGQRDGSQTLEQSLNQLVKEQMISREEALSFAAFPTQIA